MKSSTFAFWSGPKSTTVEAELGGNSLAGKILARVAVQISYGKKLIQPRQ